VGRDELIKMAVRALHGCLEAEKELDIHNTVLAIVGLNERFHIIEGEAVAPFITGLGDDVAERVVEEERTGAGVGATEEKEEE
jgi:hypothetical protein